MTEAITAGIMEIAIAIVGLVVAAVVGYVGTAAKKVLDSKQVREYSEAVKNFDEDMYASLVDLGASIEDKIRDEASNLIESDRYNAVKEAIVQKASIYASKTGVKVQFSEEELDALVNTAIREGKSAWRRSQPSHSGE